LPPQVTELLKQLPVQVAEPPPQPLRDWLFQEYPLGGEPLHPPGRPQPPLLSPPHPPAHWMVPLGVVTVVEPPPDPQLDWWHDPPSGQPPLQLELPPAQLPPPPTLMVQVCPGVTL
jgi:hypothetical protein